MKELIENFDFSAISFWRFTVFLSDKIRSFSFIFQFFIRNAKFRKTFSLNPKREFDVDKLIMLRSIYVLRYIVTAQSWYASTVIKKDIRDSS